jgi:hypothetical protein
MNRLKFPIIFDDTCARVLFMMNRHNNFTLAPTSSDFVHCTHSARIIGSEMGEFIECDRCGARGINKACTKGELQCSHSRAQTEYVDKLAPGK